MRMTCVRTCGGFPGVSWSVRYTASGRGGQRCIRSSNRYAPFRTITAFGLINILLVRFGLVSLARAMKLASRRFGLRFHAVVFADGSAAVDVDNERTYGISEMVLKQRMGIS